MYVIYGIEGSNPSLTAIFACMLKLVDEVDSKSIAGRRSGSSPDAGTNKKRPLFEAFLIKHISLVAQRLYQKEPQVLRACLAIDQQLL